MQEEEGERQKERRKWKTEEERAQKAESGRATGKICCAPCTCRAGPTSVQMSERGQSGRHDSRCRGGRRGRVEAPSEQSQRQRETQKTQTTRQKGAPSGAGSGASDRD